MWELRGLGLAGSGACTRLVFLAYGFVLKIYYNFFFAFLLFNSLTNHKVTSFQRQHSAGGHRCLVCSSGSAFRP